MTQNARVALYIPTGADADPGEIIEVRGNAPIGKPLPTRFWAQAGSTGSVGEAPVDGKLYARQNADWAITVTAAPNDGVMYAQKSNAWQPVPLFPEAPADGQQYARQDGGWSVVTGMPDVIDGGVM
jgi:hypothetical protein